jgi:hypothetical protein
LPQTLHATRKLRASLASQHRQQRPFAMLSQPLIFGTLSRNTTTQILLQEQADEETYSDLLAVTRHFPFVVQALAPLV